MARTTSLISDAPTLVREIAVGAADDADWPALAAAPPAVHLMHPGGHLNLYFRVIDHNGLNVARGSMTFAFELQRRHKDWATDGTPVVGALPNAHYVEENAAPGGYLVRVLTKASAPATATHLQIWAQAGGR